MPWWQCKRGRPCAGGHQAVNLAGTTFVPARKFHFRVEFFQGFINKSPTASCSLPPWPRFSQGESWAVHEPALPHVQMETLQKMIGSSVHICKYTAGLCHAFHVTSWDFKQRFCSVLQQLLQLISYKCFRCAFNPITPCTAAVIPVLNSEMKLTVSAICNHFESRMLDDLHALEIKLLFKLYCWAIDICYPLENFRMLYWTRHDALLLNKKITMLNT